MTIWIGSITIGYSKNDQISDEKWQNDQIELLSKQVLYLESIDNKLVRANADSIASQ